MCPAGPLASSSRRLARPPQTLLTTEVPLWLGQVREPVSGFCRRRICVFHTPKLKSKSGAPSRALEAGGKDISSPVDVSSSRVNVATKIGSQVLPPSSENDCSTWWKSGVMSDQTNRTKIVRPLNDSWSKSSPRPFLNRRSEVDSPHPPRCRQSTDPTDAPADCKETM